MFVWVWSLACSTGVEGRAETDAVVQAHEAPTWVEPTSLEDPLPTTVCRAFAPPEGATRVDGGACGTWLQDRGVVDLPLVPGDLQQCTDSALRLRAEWQRSIGVSPSFHSERNEELPWSRFEAGEQPYRVDGKLL